MNCLCNLKIGGVGNLARLEYFVCAMACDVNCFFISRFSFVVKNYRVQLSRRPFRLQIEQKSGKLTEKQFLFILKDVKFN